MSRQARGVPAPPRARAGPQPGPFGWIAEPTAELIELLDA